MIKEIKKLHELTGLSYRATYKTLGINGSWYNKAMDNYFHCPNMHRMIVIRDYLTAVYDVQNKFRTKL